MIRFLTIASLLAFAAAAGGQNSPISPRESVVSTSGRGETQISPTFASVRVGVTTTSSNAAEAASQNATRVASTIAAIQRAGVDTADVTQISYNLSQSYDNKSKPNGFNANSSIRVEIRRLSEVGRVIDAAIGGGATDVNSIQFSATNLEEARRSALAAAVREARTDAEAIARAAGGRLGRTVLLSTGGIALPFVDADRTVQFESVVATAASGPTRVIAPRELKITAVVSGQWEFIPGPAR
jgi:uncharacterized protein YggE